jgi:hypothetical protein
MVTQAVRTRPAYNVSEMEIEIDEDERTLIVRALEQYHAYLVSQQRGDRYLDLANRIKGIRQRNCGPCKRDTTRPLISKTSKMLISSSEPLPRKVRSRKELSTKFRFERGL